MPELLRPDRARRAPVRRAQVVLGGAALAGIAWLLGPLRPGALPGAPTLVPHRGQSHVHTVLVSLGWAIAVDTVLCAVLIATAGFWARPLGTPRRVAPTARGRALGAGAWLLILAAVVLAGALRWPLAHRGVWWDEAWTVRHTVVGRLEPGDGAGAVDFKPVSWSQTLWYYHAPTNHAAYSVAARITNDAWRRIAGAAPQAFDEFALRLPAYAAALAAVLLAGVLVGALGFPRAAPVAALLLALHPWAVRYGADARGYSATAACALLGAWLLLRALRSGSWPAFLGFAASQLLLLWTFPLAIYVPLSFGIAGAIAIVADGARRGEQRALLLARFAVANLLAAMAFLLVMAPNLAQAAAFQKEWSDTGKLGLGWLRQLWPLLAVGLPARTTAEADLDFPSVAALSAQHAWLPALLFGVLPALALVGLVRALARGDAAERGAWLGLVGALPLFLLHRRFAGFFLLPRFGFFGVAALMPLLALGLEGAALALPVRGRAARRGAVLATLALGTLGYAALAAPELRVLAQRPTTASRELVTWLRQAGKETPGGVLCGGLGLGGDTPRVYDPEIVEVSKLAQLRKLAERSRSEGKPLYVFYSFARVNELRSRQVIDPARDPALFQPVARFDAIDPELVIHLLRYTGAPF